MTLFFMVSNPSELNLREMFLKNLIMNCFRIDEIIIYFLILPELCQRVIRLIVIYKRSTCFLIAGGKSSFIIKCFMKV